LEAYVGFVAGGKKPQHEQKGPCSFHQSKAMGRNETLQTLISSFFSLVWVLSLCFVGEPNEA